MRRSLLFLAVALVWSGVAYGQVGTLGLYRTSNPTFNEDCGIVDSSAGLLSVYVVHVGTGGATAAQFSAPVPSCFVGSYLSDTAVFPVTVGNSQDGVGIGYGVCQTGDLHILTINLFAQGLTPSCCVYEILPDPRENPPILVMTDCDFNIHDITAKVGIFNPDGSCPCGGFSGPINPLPTDGATAQALNSTLSWGVSQPENGPFTYDVHFGTSAVPPLAVAGISVATYDPGPLDYGTTYYWNVTVHDDLGHVVTGPTWEFTTIEAGNSELVVASVFHYCGLVTTDSVVVDVLIDNAPGPIDAGGFDLLYPSDMLQFVECRRGELTVNWEHLACADLGSSVRIGGYNVVPIAEGSYGVFAQVVFTSDICSVVEPGTAEICPVNLTDDLVGFAPVCGTYEYDRFYADGDLNNDRTNTPQDALCAFKAYLEFPDPPQDPECAPRGWDVKSDVNCSMDITPADALCIFDKWLDGSCEMCIDWPPVGGPQREIIPGIRAKVAFGMVRMVDDVIVVPVRVGRVPRMKAFGFELTYPKDQIEYVSASSTVFTKDMDQLGASVHEDGRVRVGAFSSEPVNASAPIDVVELRFKPLNENPKGKIRVDTYVDNLRGADPVERPLMRTDDGDDVLPFALYQNYPNPFNPVTEISYKLSTHTSTAHVSLVVYDVQGKRVRQLVDEEQQPGVHCVQWDGRNDRGASVSSGIYFYVLKAGTETLKKKMLLLK